MTPEDRARATISPRKPTAAGAEAVTDQQGAEVEALRENNRHTHANLDFCIEQRDALAQRIETLTRERDEWKHEAESRGEWEQNGPAYLDRAEAAEARIETLEREVQDIGRGWGVTLSRAERAEAQVETLTRERDEAREAAAVFARAGISGRPDDAEAQRDRLAEALRAGIALVMSRADSQDDESGEWVDAAEQALSEIEQAASNDGEDSQAPRERGA